MLLLTCAVFFFLIVAWYSSSVPIKIVIIGDSTVMTYNESYYPQCGWGQELQYFFQEQSVVIDNRAIGGRSSRSFIEEGRWETVKATLNSGDIVLIQFGHNDRSTVAERHADTSQYREYLAQYVIESRQKGAIPVLITPMNMNTWNGNTLRQVFKEGANDYCTALMRVVDALNVPYIDLEEKSRKLFQSYGQEYISRFLFLSLEPNEYPNYPEGKSDGTHFQEMGAVAMAKLIAEGIEELQNNEELEPLANLLAPQYPLYVIKNKEVGSLVTKISGYPKNVPLTIKIISQESDKFEYWRGDDGTNLGNDNYFFTSMPDSGLVFYAMFEGGTLSANGSDLIHPNKRVVNWIREKSGILKISSTEPITKAVLRNTKGKTLSSHLFSGDLTVYISTENLPSANILSVYTTKREYSMLMKSP